MHWVRGRQVCGELDPNPFVLPFASSFGFVDKYYNPPLLFKSTWRLSSNKILPCKSKQDRVAWAGGRSLSSMPQPRLAFSPTPVPSSSHHNPRKPWKTTALDHLAQEKMLSSSPAVTHVSPFLYRFWWNHWKMYIRVNSGGQQLWLCKGHI